MNSLALGLLLAGSQGGGGGASAPTAPGYLDTTVAPYAAYGPQRMVSGYSGPLFTLRRNDGTTLDVSAQTSGDYPDYDAIDTWAGADIPTVATLHDQSGNGRHLTQATAANQPSFDTSQRFGDAVPILFDGFGRTGTAANPQVEKTLGRGSLASFDVSNMSSFMALQPQTGFNAAGHWYAGPEDGASALVEQFQLTSANRLNIRVAAGNRQRSLGAMIDFTPNVIGFDSAAGTTRIYGNGTNSGIGVAITSANLDRLTIGKALFSAENHYGAYRLFGAVFYNSGVGATNGTTIVASLNAAFAHGNGYGVTPEYNVTFAGDSITEGTGSRLLKNTPRLVDASLTKARKIQAMSVSGERMSTAYAARVGRYANTFVSGIPNVVFLQYGTNDIGAGTTGASLYADTAAPFITYLQSLGYLVVICTLLPREDAGWSGPMETERLAYNVLVRANTAAANAVLDLTANTVMGPDAAALDTTLYPDNLHPSSLGYAWLAGAPSGTYSAANTYYDTLLTMLRSTALGGSYVP